MVPDEAFLATQSDYFFEEGTADVFASFVAVNVFFTESNVARRLGLQTIQSVGEERSAFLKSSEKPPEHLEPRHSVGASVLCFLSMCLELLGEENGDDAAAVVFLV